MNQRKREPKNSRETWTESTNIHNSIDGLTRSLLILEVKEGEYNENSYFEEEICHF